MKTISFIGAGNMAYAMAGALYKQNPINTIGVYDIDINRVNFFKDSFNSTCIFNSINSLIEESDIIVLSVKPQVIDKVLSKMEQCSKIVISIAAGISLKYLTNKLKQCAVTRVMPNTPALVGKMAAGVSFSPSMNENQKSIVLDFLSCSGIALEVKESQMDAVTGLSGSGPAFVARIIQCFINAGIDQGLEESVSKELAVNTFLGTANLILEKNMDIEELITMVSSPGGTTIAGRSVLESSNIGDIIKNTVDATVIRSRELGKS